MAMGSPARGLHAVLWKSVRLAWVQPQKALETQALRVSGLFRAQEAALSQGGPPQGPLSWLGSRLLLAAIRSSPELCTTAAAGGRWRHRSLPMPPWEAQPVMRRMARSRMRTTQAVSFGFQWLLSAYPFNGRPEHSPPKP